MAIPIEVAPARAGTAPAISIRYASNGGNGPVGLGWVLELGTIRNNEGRAVAAGPHQYVTADGTIDIDHHGRLLHHSAALEFAQLSGGGWRMRDSFGERYDFGVTAAGRVEALYFTAAWHLQHFEDRFGNSRDYQYLAGTGHLLPTCIEYGGNPAAGIAHTAHLEFAYEARPDRVRNYRALGSAVITQRLATITSYSGGGCGAAGRIVYSRYNLKYVSSGSSGRSLLSEVERMGARGQNSFRPLRFQYASGTGGWNSVIGPHPPVPTGLYGDNCITTDLNGNGRTDLACQPRAGDWVVGMRRFDQTGGGTGFSGPAVDPVEQVSQRCVSSDFSGDGKDDLLCEQSGAWTAAVSSGRGWTPSDRFPPRGVNAQNCLHADANADGRTDMYCSLGGEIVLFAASDVGWRPSGAVIRAPSAAVEPDIRRRCTTGDFFRGDGRIDIACYEAGNSWAVGTTSGEIGVVFTGPAPSLPIGQSCLSADFSGDGVTDLACSTGGTDWAMYISTGTDFVNEPWANGAAARTPLGDYCTPIDINADGLADIACKLAGVGQVQVAASTGNGWLTRTTTFEVEVATPLRRNCVFGNFRGGGASDILCNGIVALAGGDGDRLRRFENSLGGIIEFEYAPISAYWDQGTSQQLAVAPAVVISQLVSDNGLGQRSVTEYDFDEGYFDPGSQQFRGFGHVTIRHARGRAGQGLVQEYWFLQGDDGAPGPVAGTTGSMQGRVYRERTSIGAPGALQPIEERRTTYHDDIALGYRPVRSVTSFRCEAAACTPVLETESSWDRYGNLISRRERDPSAARAFDQSVAWTYLSRPDLHLFSLPTSESRFGAVRASPLFQSRFTYGEPRPECPTANAPPQGLALSRIEIVGSPNETVSMRFGHDRVGNRVCQLDPAGGRMTYEWDPTATFQTSMTSMTGATASLSWRLAYYDGRTAGGLYGQLAQIFDPHALAVASPLARYSYDDLGRLTSTETGGAATTVSYVALGDPRLQTIRLQAANGLFSEVRLDGASRPVRSRWSGAGSQVLNQTFSYDDRGKLVLQSLPFLEGGQPAGSIGLKYDGAGRLVEIVRPDRTSLTWCHRDLELVSIDPRGAARRERRDGRGLLVSVEEFADLGGSCEMSGRFPYAATSFHYDALNRLARTTDANAVDTAIDYDGLGRVSEIRDPYAGTRRFTYDAAGRTASLADGEGRRVEFAYDLMGRLTQRRSGTGVSDYAYDQTPNTMGRLAEVRDPTGSTGYGYDDAGRVTAVSKVVSGRTFTLGYSYDNMGRPTSLTYPSGRAVAYAYDGAELGTVHFAGALIASLSQYDEFGRARLITYGNGLTETREFGAPLTAGCSDPRLLCATRLRSSATTVAAREMRYDNAGNVASVSDGAGNDWTYGYDGLGRLTQARLGAASYAYRYDRVGNLMFDSGLGEYRYPAATDPLPYAAQGVGTTSFAHDRAGNLTAIRPGTGSTLARADYGYDGEGRLVRAEVAGRTTQFQYDGEGRRALVGTDLRRVGNAHRCDGSQCADTIFLGTAVIAEAGSAVSYRHADHLGSSMAFSSAAGSVTAQIQYMPFGQSLPPASPPTSPPWRYGGQFLHDDAALYENGARFYHPQLGRFLTPDPASGDPGQPQSLNRYSYALNRPTNLVDATGFSAEDPDGAGDDGEEGGNDDSSHGGSNDHGGPHHGGGSGGSSTSKFDKPDHFDVFDGPRMIHEYSAREPPPPPPPPPGTDIGGEVATLRSRLDNRVTAARESLNPLMRDTALPHMASGLLTATIGYLGIVTLSAAAVTPIGMVALLGSSMAMSAGIFETGLGLAQLAVPNQRESGSVRTVLMLSSSPLALTGGAIGGFVNGERGVRMGAGLGAATQSLITFDRTSALQGATFYLDARSLEDYVRTSMDRDAANLSPLP